MPGSERSGTPPGEIPPGGESPGERDSSEKVHAPPAVRTVPPLGAGWPLARHRGREILTLHQPED
jgi:hypothetical protein